MSILTILNPVSPQQEARGLLIGLGGFMLVGFLILAIYLITKASNKDGATQDKNETQKDNSEGNI